MKLLDLYIEELGKHLPVKTRKDIQAEIKSTLLDMLEERSANENKPVDDDMVKAVLAEYGSPQKVASQYGEHNYLISPRIYPAYISVLRIVGVVLVAVMLFVMVLTNLFGNAPAESLGIAILESLMTIVNMLVISFGIITLIFALIERTSPDEIKFETESWKPESLLEKDNTPKVKLVELALEITFTIIGFVLITFYRDAIAIYNFTDGGWDRVPLLSDAIVAYLPYIIAYMGLTIALDLYVIRKMAWDIFAQIAKIALKVVNIVITIFFITGPDLIKVSEEGLAKISWLAAFPGITEANINAGLNRGLDILLIIAIFGLVVETIKSTATLIKVQKDFPVVVKH